MLTPEEADNNESTNQAARLKQEYVTLPRKKNTSQKTEQTIRSHRIELIPRNSIYINGTEKQLKSNR